MINLETLRADVARAICNTDPDPMWNCGAACRVEAEPAVGPCEHQAAASAAIARVLEAVNELCNQRYTTLGEKLSTAKLVRKRHTLIDRQCEALAIGDIVRKAADAARGEGGK